MFHKLIKLIDSSGVPHRRLTHKPTPTSAESAAVRGVPLSSGAKAMMLKTGNKRKTEHFLLVLSAAKKLDLKRVKALLGKTARFVGAEEVRKVTGCIPGAVPPFGSAFEGSAVSTLVDRSLLEQGDTINFNVGLRTESVCDLPVEAYLKLEQGHKLVDVAE